MKCLIIFLLMVLVMESQSTNQKSFEGYKVFNINVNTEDQFNSLRQMQIDADRDKIDFWVLSKPNKSATVMVAPEYIDTFLDDLNTLNAEYSLSNINVQERIEEERASLKKTP